MFCEFFDGLKGLSHQVGFSWSSPIYLPLDNQSSELGHFANGPPVMTIEQALVVFAGAEVLVGSEAAPGENEVFDTACRRSNWAGPYADLRVSQS